MRFWNELWRDPVFEEIRSSALAVVPRVFEMMFFTVLDPEGEISEKESPQDRDLPMLRGEIGFEGRYAGRMFLFVPLDFAQAMARNFLGDEDDAVSEPQVTDVIKEVCNMICGNMFSELDKGTVWNLTIPQTKRILRREMDAPPCLSGVVIDFNTDGHRVKLRIDVAEDRQDRLGGDTGRLRREAAAQRGRTFRKAS